MKWIPYGRQELSDADVAAVVQVLESEFITQGPVSVAFESAVADYCNVPFSIAVNSATSALHIACLAMNIGPGDLVWTSPNTFVASANCARYCGAEVDFVDIDSQTYNLCAQALEQKLHKASRSGAPLPALVIVVHFAGQSCDMKAIHRLSQLYGFKIIEDASHAIGGSYLGKPVGQCEFSDACVFSFHPVKIITSGEGGMIMTASSELAERMRQYRSHGIVREPEYDQTGCLEQWAYQQISLGFNYRLTDIQAALGLSQLNRLNEFVEKRRVLAARYDQLLQGYGYVLPSQSNAARSAHHLYPILVPDEPQCRTVRNKLYRHLHEASIGVNVHYIPVHSQPYYRSLGFRWGDYPVAEAYYERTLTLPLFSSLCREDQDRVIESLQGFLHQRLAA